jgi:hypothetical protein
MTELIEAIARAIAREKRIEICSDASYRHSTFGPLAQAALAAITDAGYRIAPGWQPIETAPKEYGSCIIACRKGWADSVGPVWWRTGRWTQADGEAWVEGWLTHWMPLPAAPGHEK